MENKLGSTFQSTNKSKRQNQTQKEFRMAQLNLSKKNAKSTNAKSTSINGNGKKSTVAKSTKPAKKSGTKPALRSVDYSKLDSPFRQNTSQGLVFDLIRSGKVKRSDLKDKALAALKHAKLTTKNVSTLISTTLKDAQNRGWEIKTTETKSGDVISVKR